MLQLSDKVVNSFAVPAPKDYTNYVLGKVFAPAEEKQSDEQAQWTQELAKSSMEYLAKRRGQWLKKAETEAKYNQSNAKLVQKLCKQLSIFASEFNYAIGWKDLYVTMTEPSLVTEVLRYNKFREPLESVTTFRARLSTRHMSLVIKGNRNKIEFFLMPVEKVIGLSKAEEDLKPVYTLEAEYDASTDSIEWSADQETLDEILKSQFTDLIHESREQASNQAAA